MVKYLALVIVLCSTIFIKAQTVELKQGWYLKNADSAAFALPNYNHNHWKPVWTGVKWQSFPEFAQLHGVNWYRIKVNIPKNFQNEQIGGLFLNLKRIDDADETYLNGVLVGKTGVHSKDSLSTRNEYRNYFLPNRFIKFGEENCIAIRVKDFGDRGGLYDGGLKIYASETKITDEKTGYVKLGTPIFDGKDKFTFRTTLSDIALAVIKKNQGTYLDLSPFKNEVNISVNGEKAELKGRRANDLVYLLSDQAFKSKELLLEIQLNGYSAGSLFQPIVYLNPVIRTELLKIGAVSKVGKAFISTQVKLNNPSNYTIEGKLQIAYTTDMYLLKDQKILSVKIPANSDTVINIVSTQKFTGALKIEARFTDTKTHYSIEKVAFSEFVLNNTLDSVQIPMNAFTYSDTKPGSFKVGFKVHNVVNDVYQPFTFANQQISGSLGYLFLNSQDKRLLKVDTAEIMSGYLHRPGKQTYIGEHAGKYIQAATNSWMVTQNQQLKKNLDDVVKRLIGAQLPDGYLGTYVPKDYWTEWDVWSHKYNLIGLLTYYRATGSPQVLETCIHIGNLLSSVFGDLPGQKSLSASGGHKGMASGSVLEPIVDLYRLTGNPKYLAFANYIVRNYNTENGSKLVESLVQTGNVYKTANAKAYEMISNLTGVLRLYKLTGETTYLKACTNAWNDIRTKRLYITGTASSHEHFQENQFLPFDESDKMGEGCVTTTWIQFTLDLFRITGNSRFMDEIERSVHNHLTGAENVRTGCVSYYTPLRGRKPHSCTLGTSCCLSSVPRGISYIPQEIWGNFNGGLGVFQYTQGTVNDTLFLPFDKKIPVQLKVLTNYPETGNISIVPNFKQKVEASIYLRVPAFTSYFSATVGGKTYNGKPGSMLEMNRIWNLGDTIRVSIKLDIQVIRGFEEFSNLVAIQRGPQVLALDSLFNQGLEIEKLNISKIESNNLVLKNYQGKYPDGWLGKQGYEAVFGVEKRKLVFTPFNISGQFYFPMTVWFKAGI